MVKLKPASLRSIARKWAAGRFLAPRLGRFWQYLLGWLGLAVLILDAGGRWARAVIANGRKAWRAGIRECGLLWEMLGRWVGRLAAATAKRRRRMSARWAELGARTRVAWTRRRAKVASRWVKQAAGAEGRARVSRRGWVSRRGRLSRRAWVSRHAWLSRRAWVSWRGRAARSAAAERSAAAVAEGSAAGMTTAAVAMAAEGAAEEAGERAAGEAGAQAVSGTARAPGEGTAKGRAKVPSRVPREGTAKGRAKVPSRVPGEGAAKGRAKVPSRVPREGVAKGGLGGGRVLGRARGLAAHWVSQRWMEEDAAGRGKARRGAGKKKRRGRRFSAERGAAERNALSWGKIKRGRVTVPPLKAYRRGLTRWMAARRPSGGWRVAAGWATGICAAAGLGILLGALTLQPPRPPQPAPQAMPSQAQGSGVALPRALPTRIEIPAIGVDAGLLSLGVDDKDELVVPPLDRAELASWYNLGPSPGEGGSAVIVGHVDSAEIGPAVFFNLGRLKPGDVITVTRKDGTRPNFKVDSVQTFLKTSFPTRLVYEGEQATLRVITCGGEFDKKIGSYLSNVVVFASLDT